MRLLAAAPLALLAACAPAPAAPTPEPAGPSVAYQWLDVALDVTGDDVARHGARPTVQSRALAIVATAMYDAWAAYDAVAVGTRLGGKLRRPPRERTRAHREEAVSYAAYRALVDVYPDEVPSLARALRRFGLDPAATTTDPRDPAGVGNLAAAAVLAFRHGDGANQLGDDPRGDGTPYADTTGYRPVNPPDRIVDPDRWQPIAFDDGKGGRVTPGFLTPHWHLVKPFALARADELRPPPPPKVGSDELLRQTKEVVDAQASLDCEKKAIVELMRDGPRSTGQSGHWLRFAESVSRRDHDDLDADVKLFFAVANVAMDAFIASWDAKQAYDSARPWTLVHHYFKGQTVRGWAGPDTGTTTIKGEDWRPYSPATFVTPPFPGYTSGHSTVSAACAEVLRRFTGSDRFGERATRRCGELTESPGAEVTLSLPTFTSAAEMAGISRVYGGYHLRADNEAGLALGRRVAEVVWPRIQAYFDGSAAER